MSRLPVLFLGVPLLTPKQDGIPLFGDAPALKNCSFQKESVVCGRRIGIRKGSGEKAYYPRHEDPSYSLSCSENRQENNYNSDYW